MTNHLFEKGIIGNDADKPDAGNVTGKAENVSAPVYFAADTGKIYVSTGHAWVQIGSFLPGVTSDGLGGMNVAGKVASRDISVNDLGDTVFERTASGTNFPLDMTDWNGPTSGDSLYVQSFTPTQTITCNALRVWAKANPALTVQQKGQLELFLALYADSSNAPDPDTRLAVVDTPSLVNLAGAYVPITGDFGQDIVLSANTKYWITVGLLSNNETTTLVDAVDIDAGGTVVPTFDSPDGGSTFEVITSRSPMRFQLVNALPYAVELSGARGSIHATVPARFDGGFTIGNPIRVSMTNVDPSTALLSVPGAILLQLDGHALFNILAVTQGLGLFGVTPPLAPRTLAQSAITAITDANAKTAVQALANTLADMGALTLT